MPPIFSAVLIFSIQFISEIAKALLAHLIKRLWFFASAVQMESDNPAADFAVGHLIVFVDCDNDAVMATRSQSPQTAYTSRYQLTWSLKSPVQHVVIDVRDHEWFVQRSLPQKF
jgi:hypothetical protein